MNLVYNALILLYSNAIRLAAIFGNEKALSFVSGRKDIFKNIRKKLQPDEKRIWVHVASLGEFEQGRPIIEKIKEKHPGYKIFLTFFSPSGYDVRKNYNGADYIFYLPMDTPWNAGKFVNMIGPSIVFFIKYEYWYNYLTILKHKGIPTYLCSAIFRPQQVFFKWYGGWYRQILQCFTHIFVQTANSIQLLKGIGISNITLTGDTRFDRVYSIAINSREIEEVKTFVNGKNCFIAGSSWGPDEDLFCKYLNETNLVSKSIIAPHEIDPTHIEKIEMLLKKKAVRYSVWRDNPTGDFDVLIIDNIGMLSSLYRYGQVAYIGGGFGKGIHNILEAATFGLPVIFGPNYKKFQEAIELIQAGGAFSIDTYDQLKQNLDSLYLNSDKLKNAAEITRTFIKRNVGATEAILTSLSF